MDKSICQCTDLGLCRVFRDASDLQLQFWGVSENTDADADADADAEAEVQLSVHWKDYKII